MSESDGYIDHAEEERLSVFAKYDKGREEGAKIDDWEDPTLEIYHVMDRYGFIHDREVPRLKAEEKRANLELERSEKWLKMTQRDRWPYSKSSEKLKNRTYKGIPNKFRPKVWALFLDIQTIKEQQRGKYEEMYELARKYSPDVRQVDLDVNRTYRDTIMFRQRYGKEQKTLFNILCAYSIYNSEVGYCQGMSQVAALLLMYLEEEDAFWGLAQLMTHTKYGMHGFFIPGFPKLVRFQAHHDKVMQQMLPKLKRHFDKHGVDCGLYTLKWFFQCFLDRVPFELSLRLWDIFLLEGDRVLICGAYTILKIHQKQLLARKSMDDILNYIQVTIPAHFAVDNDKAMEEYKKFSEELHSKKLDTGGEPSDDELPKKPFGIIENIPKHVPKEVPKTKIKMETRATLAEEEIMDDEKDHEQVVNSMVEKHSTSQASLAATSAASTSIDDSRGNSAPRPLSSVSNASYASATSARADITSNGSSEQSTPLKMNGSLHKGSNIVASTPKFQPTEGEGDSTSMPRRKEFEEAFQLQELNNVEERTETQTKTMEISAEEELAFNKLLEEFESFELSNSFINHSSRSSSHRSQTSSSHSQPRSQIPIFKKKSPSPPPPPPRSPSNIHDKSYIASTQINYTARTRASPSPDHLGGRKRVPPSVNPRRLLGTTVVDRNMCGVSSSETVRIHVPYSIPTPTHPPQGEQLSPRNNGYDINKSDPNRITIDVSSHSTLIQ